MEGLVCLSWLKMLTGLACGEEVPDLLVCTQHYQNRAWAGETVRGRDQNTRPEARGTGFSREKVPIREQRGHRITE